MRLIRDTMGERRRPRFRLFNSAVLLEVLFVLWWLVQGLVARLSGGSHEAEADSATPPSDETVLVPELKQIQGLQALAPQEVGARVLLAGLLYRTWRRFAMLAHRVCRICGRG